MKMCYIVPLLQLSNTYMCVMYIRAYGPTVFWTPDRGRYTDMPCTLAGGKTLQQLDVEQQQGQGQRQPNTIPTGAIGNVSIQ
jgi:hypothetical protein